VVARPERRLGRRPGRRPRSAPVTSDAARRPRLVLALPSARRTRAGSVQHGARTAAGAWRPPCPVRAPETCRDRPARPADEPLPPARTELELASLGASPCHSARRPPTRRAEFPALQGLGAAVRASTRRRPSELPDARAPGRPKVLNTAVASSATLRLGRHEREGGVAIRRPGARRLRLLGLRLARLQASGLPGRRRARLDDQGPNDLPDERRSRRIQADRVREARPGDVLFFGPSGPRSKPASIGHTGIYLGAAG
jgi:hypothetical protein